MSRVRGVRVGVAANALLLVLTVGQLIVATTSSLPQFEGKAFGARLAAYPVLMLVVPLLWWLRNRRQPTSPPWAAFALVMAPFLVDVTGNTLDLYDAISWWDDLNHLVNWFLLMAGLGLLIRRVPGVPRPLLVLSVTGLGALLAVGWELAEWFTFIRHGTELAGAYTDTLGDEALGSLGGFLAALVVSGRTSAAEAEEHEAGSDRTPPAR